MTLQDLQSLTDTYIYIPTVLTKVNRQGHSRVNRKSRKVSSDVSVSDRERRRSKLQKILNNKKSLRSRSKVLVKTKVHVRRNTLQISRHKSVDTSNLFCNKIQPESRHKSVDTKTLFVSKTQPESRHMSVDTNNLHLHAGSLGNHTTLQRHCQYKTRSRVRVHKKKSMDPTYRRDQPSPAPS